MATTTPILGLRKPEPADDVDVEADLGDNFDLLDEAIGDLQTAVGSGVVTLTDGATVAVDSSLGKIFSLTAAGDRTVSAPTGDPVDGQALIIRHTASGADRTLTLTVGSSGAFKFGTDFTGLTATTSGTTDYIGCVYSTTAQRWHVVSYAKGL